MSRELRLSICAYGPGKSNGFDLQRHIRNAGELVTLAADEGADLAVLPETYALQQKPNMYDEGDPLDGPVITSLRKLARERSVGIVAGHVTLENGRRYNSLVMLDRRGEIVSIYHKTYPTIHELERGIIPGPGAVAVDTEFGRIGFAICYDLNFSELRDAYRNLDVDLIVFGSAYRGGLAAQAWAYETRSYLVSSVIDPKSLIINPLGRIVAQTDTFSRSVTSTINLDCEVVHLDYTNKQLDDARRRYGKEIELEWSDPEGVFLLTSRGKQSAKQIIAELGWRSVEQYFAESRAKRAIAMSGEPVPAGPSPW